MADKDETVVGSSLHMIVKTTTPPKPGDVQTFEIEAFNIEEISTAQGGTRTRKVAADWSHTSSTTSSTCSGG